MLVMFYRAVVQVVLPFDSESWVLSEAMDKMVEGEHTGFLCQRMGKQVRQNMGGTWVTLVVGEVQEAAGTQSEDTYIFRRHGTVAQWVALRPIFEVCARENGY